MEQGARFDSKDKCTVCQDPWVSTRGEWGRCLCPAIAVLGNDFKCQECHELIPSCRHCQYAKTMEKWELGKWVGWDDKISARGVHLQDTKRED